MDRGPKSIIFLPLFSYFISESVAAPTNIWLIRKGVLFMRRIVIFKLYTACPTGSFSPTCSPGHIILPVAFDIPP